MSTIHTFNRSRAKPGVYCLGHTRLESGQHTVTLSVDGTRYEYYLTSPQCDTVEFLCKQGLGRRALNYAKSRAASVNKI